MDFLNLNISQYIFINLKMNEEFAIQEVFVNMKDEVLEHKTHYVGDREKLMDSVVLKKPFIDDLLEIIDNTYDYDVFGFMDCKHIRFKTILLN